MKNKSGSIFFSVLVIFFAGSCKKDSSMITTINHSSYPQSNQPVCIDNRPELPSQLTPIATLSEARSHIAVASANGKILFAGGILSDGNYSSRVDIFDIAGNSWTKSTLTEEKFHIASAVVGKKIYFGGGELKNGRYSHLVEIYDTELNTWTTQSISGNIIQTFAAAATSNKVIFASGVTAHIYDVASGNWSSAPLSKREREGTCCQDNVGGIMATAMGDLVFFAGGKGTDVYNDIDIYDPTESEWSHFKLKEYKGHGAGIAVGYINYWAGGETYKGGKYEISREVEIWQLGSNPTIECLWQPNIDFSAVQSKNDIVFFTGTAPNSVKNKFDIYSITSKTWSVGVLPFDIESSAIISVDKTIYVAGGIQNGSISGNVYKLTW